MTIMEPQQVKISLIDPPQQATQDLAGAGVLTQVQPSAQQIADIKFCAPIVWGLNQMNIGQAVAVKEREVIAVEAIEGFDAMIRRAGQLCPSGKWLLATVAKPGHAAKSRFSSIGVRTIEQLRAAGGSCLAVEAHRVILLDKPRLLTAANRAGVVVMGINTQRMTKGDRSVAKY